MRFQFVMAALAASLVAAAPAAADRVPAPPADCPRGAVPHSSHAGSNCQPSICDSDEACAQVRLQPGVWVTDEVVCRPNVALCVREEQYTFNTYRGRNIPGTRTIADGPCINGQCPAGGTCVTASRCVAADPQTAREPDPAETTPPETTPPETTPPGTTPPRPLGARVAARSSRSIGPRAA